LAATTYPPFLIVFTGGGFKGSLLLITSFVGGGFRGTGLGGVAGGHAGRGFCFGHKNTYEKRVQKIFLQKAVFFKMSARTG
jgi:hypothetical protein